MNGEEVVRQWCFAIRRGARPAPPRSRSREWRARLGGFALSAKAMFAANRSVNATARGCGVVGVGLARRGANSSCRVKAARPEVHATTVKSIQSIAPAQERSGSAAFRCLKSLQSAARRRVHLSMKRRCDEVLQLRQSFLPARRSRVCRAISASLAFLVGCGLTTHDPVDGGATLPVDSGCEFSGYEECCPGFEDCGGDWSWSCRACAATCPALTPKQDGACTPGDACVFRNNAVCYNKICSCGVNGRWECGGGPCGPECPFTLLPKTPCSGSATCEYGPAVCECNSLNEWQCDPRAKW